jgi:hypothetical protein
MISTMWPPNLGLLIALGAIAVAVPSALLPRLRERILHFFRGSPGLLPAASILLVFVISLVPMRSHLEAEVTAQQEATPPVHRIEGEITGDEETSKDSDVMPFEVGLLDAAYGSVQLFTANMQPITLSPPSLSVRILRVVAPLVFVIGIAATFSRAVRSLWTRVLLRWFAAHLVICGPPDRIVGLVKASEGYSRVSRTKVVAVTDSPVNPEVERALRRLPARVISVVPYGSAGAFANAVSRASTVIIDFDHVETTFEFVKAALQVGRGHRNRARSMLDLRIFHFLWNDQAREVHAFVPYAIPPNFLRSVGADVRLRIRSRMGTVAQLMLADTDIQRASLDSPLRLLVVTDDPDFVDVVTVFRCLFRQAERGLIDVLLIGQKGLPAWTDGGDIEEWRRVRQVSGRGNIQYALMSLVEGRCLDGEERPSVLPSTPVFICTELYLGLVVISELDRLWSDLDAGGLSIAYVPRNSDGVDDDTSAVLVGEVASTATASIKVITSDPADLLAEAPIVTSDLPVLRGIRSHLGLWDVLEDPATLGERPHNDLLPDAVPDFVARTLDGLSAIGFDIVESGSQSQGVIGLAPEELARLLLLVEGVSPGSDPAINLSRTELERRGALLDLLARVPAWLARAGLMLKATSRAARTVRLEAEDIRLMAVEAHLTYLETAGRVASSGAGMEDRRALTGWERLEQEYQESNLEQVRHIPVKLALLGLGLERAESAAMPGDVSRWSEAVGDLNDVHFEALCRLEHARWSIEHVAQGFRYGSQRQKRQSEGPLTHPNLVPYDRLGDSDRAFDENVVASIPRILDVAGYRLRRLDRATQSPDAQG